MLLRNKLLNSTAVRNIPNEGQGGGGGQAPTGGTSQGQVGQQQQDNVDPNKFTWDNAGGNQGTQNAGNPQQQQQQQTANQQQDSSQLLQEHFSKMNILPSETFEAAMRAYNEDQNPAKLHEVMQNSMQQVYANALVTMNQVMQQRIDQAIQQSVQQSTSQINYSNTMDALQNEMPSLKSSPEMQPIAQAALQRAMQQGSNPQQAVAKVKNLMETMYGVLGKEFNATQQTPGGQGYNGHQPAIAEGDGWEDLWGGK